jgi:diaminopropionate ammonia-lyase
VLFKRQRGGLKSASRTRTLCHYRIQKETRLSERFQFPKALIMTLKIRAEFNPDLTSFVTNPNASKALSFVEGAESSLSAQGMNFARQSVSQWDGYEVTPLTPLPGLANALGVASVHYKDEGGRFGLGSFKSLGGAYAVYQLLSRMITAATGIQDITPEDLKSGVYSEHVKGITVASATDGNHGRSVAWGARQFGCNCVIYIHAEVSHGRLVALENQVAKVVRVDGNYDESVHFCAEQSDANGWYVVSDTSYKGYKEVPTNVMEGYSVLASEIIDQMNPTPPTHVFVQGGVGGLAAAVNAAFWQAWEAERPLFYVVEPDLAACIYRSVEAQAPTNVEVATETIMAGLSCGEISLVAWDILSRGADGVMIIPDSFVGPAMRLLAEAATGDTPIVAGESAVAGLAGLISARGSESLSRDLHQDENSRVVVIGSEGATDVEIYRKIVGDLADKLLAY